jgi:hypothetical protein
VNREWEEVLRHNTALLQKLEKLSQAQNNLETELDLSQHTVVMTSKTHTSSNIPIDIRIFRHTTKRSSRRTTTQRNGCSTS